ncbi:hypothetical protein EI94DRAFT_1808653 [Lactarius quietus]|nr:hypothetical protein EI94DRAFT_1808653 [Lactarius quietus]
MPLPLGFGYVTVALDGQTDFFSPSPLPFFLLHAGLSPYERSTASPHPLGHFFYYGLGWMQTKSNYDASEFVIFSLFSFLQGALYPLGRASMIRPPARWAQCGHFASAESSQRPTRFTYNTLTTAYPLLEFISLYLSPCLPLRSTGRPSSIQSFFTWKLQTAA